MILPKCLPIPALLLFCLLTPALAHAELEPETKASVGELKQALGIPQTGEAPAPQQAAPGGGNEGPSPLSPTDAGKLIQVVKDGKVVEPGSPEWEEFFNYQFAGTGVAPASPLSSIHITREGLEPHAPGTGVVYRAGPVTSGKGPGGSRPTVNAGIDNVTVRDAQDGTGVSPAGSTSVAPPKRSIHVTRDTLGTEDLLFPNVTSLGKDATFVSENGSYLAGKVITAAQITAFVGASAAAAKVARYIIAMRVNPAYAIEVGAASFVLPTETPTIYQIDLARMGLSREQAAEFLKADNAAQKQACESSSAYRVLCSELTALDRQIEQERPVL